MDADLIRQMIKTSEDAARQARFNADLYAEVGSKGGRVAGAKGFAKKGGVDAFHLATLVKKAEDAERALADLNEMARTLGIVID